MVVMPSFRCSFLVDDELGGAGGVVVGQPDQALILGLEQILPILRGLEAEAGELIGVDHEAEDALVDAEPEIVRMLVHRAGQVSGVDGVIGLQQALGGDDIVGVGRAAEPDVGGGIAVLLFDLGLHLTGGQTLVSGFDAVELLEVLAGESWLVMRASMPVSSTRSRMFMTRSLISSFGTFRSFRP